MWPKTQGKSMRIAALREILIPSVLVGVGLYVQRRQRQRAKECREDEIQLVELQTSDRSRFSAWLILIVATRFWERLAAKLSAKAGKNPRTLPKSLKFLSKMTHDQWILIRTLGNLSVLVTASRQKVLPYWLCYTLPATIVMGVQHSRYYEIFFLIFVVVPLLEVFFGQDTTNPSPQESKELNERKAFRLVPMSWALSQPIMLAWSLWAQSKLKLSIPQFIALAASLGTVTGVLGINIAHELIHKDTALERGLGQFLMAQVCYGHWVTEHLFGHHKRVSTMEDPATSRMGESFYAFWFRSIKGGWESAWELERKRLGGFAWTPKNGILQLGMVSFLGALASYKYFGKRALALFLGQSAVAVSMLEIINYIEHYGLRREKLPQGGYEAVKVTHSWNADASFTNAYLFKLQRHSDHHANAGRRYQILRSFEQSPQMPTGYAGMMTLALFPPLWFRVMDPLLKQHQRARDEGIKIADDSEETS
jgi:alkane 1-monooxygenase